MLFAFFRAEKTVILGYRSGQPKAPENPVYRRPRESEKPQNVENYDIRFFYGAGFRSFDIRSVCNFLNNYIGKLPLSNGGGRGTSIRLSKPLQQTGVLLFCSS